MAWHLQHLTHLPVNLPRIDTSAYLVRLMLELALPGKICIPLSAN